MNDITIIIPIHKLTSETKTYLSNAVESVLKNRENYSQGVLKVLMVVPIGFEHIEYLNNEYISKNENFLLIENDGETDFCSQVNFGVKKIKENEMSQFFSILEFDDEFSPKWFKMVSDYYFTNEDVSVFLPVNVQCDTDKTKWQFCNEMVLASSFSNEIGFIDKDCLENCTSFNLTGGVFNLNDFIAVGGLKPSIEVAFNYEFLLRVTNKKYKVYVVPKEGYFHIVGREDSLMDKYFKTMDEKTIDEWFNVAKREYVYDEDRKKGILDIKSEIIK